MRLACDTGGTFTDLIVEAPDGGLQMFKASTTPDDPVVGVIDAIRLAAAAHGQSLDAFLAGVSTFIHGTTHAINAVITGRTAKTAFLTTRGHRDMLVLREGGRQEPFNFEAAFPEPYIPRALTFEVTERIDVAGEVVEPLDEAALVALCGEIAARGVEAVAVCLLWSVANPAHELRVGALLERHLPGTPYTLSHQLNPTIREFRRASAAAIDASLKPLMVRYLGSLTERLNAAGFGGRVLVLTSQGGMADAGEVASQPIRAINSGPSLAPVAGKYFGDAAMSGADIIVADTGGTTYDVSLVRGGRIPLTRDAWIGPPFRGHLTGFPSVDVQSVGAGGGSIGRVDSGGLLKVGPQSAGSRPGPACYGRGGVEPTLTDAALVLGYIDPKFFLGGTMALDAEAAAAAVREKVAAPLGIGLHEAAGAILSLATENMVQAIADITVSQGIDPRRAVLIGGGGAAGLNSIFIARRMGIPRLVIPELGPALSAAGALMSELAADYRASKFLSTAAFDPSAANTVLAELEARAEAFLAAAGPEVYAPTISFAVEARYEGQVWEIDVPLPFSRFRQADDVDLFREKMHAAHERIFAFRDAASAIELIGWSARASCRVHDQPIGRIVTDKAVPEASPPRDVWFPGHGAAHADVRAFEHLAVDVVHPGPAIVESRFTTVVVDPSAVYRRDARGSLIVDIHSPEEATA